MRARVRRVAERILLIENSGGDDGLLRLRLGLRLHLLMLAMSWMDHVSHWHLRSLGITSLVHVLVHHRLSIVLLGRLRLHHWRRTHHHPTVLTVVSLRHMHLLRLRHVLRGLLMHVYLSHRHLSMHHRHGRSHVDWLRQRSRVWS